MMVFPCDFNDTGNNCYTHDKTNFQRIAMENISLQCGLCQVINKHTHNLENSSSCTDLIYFSTQPNY